MTVFTLVRHGQTDWNVARRYQGHQDIPLNDEGIQQAHNLALLLKDEVFDAIYSSDLQRAMQTARIFQEERDIAVIADERLREICFGDWEGATLQEMRAAFPKRFTLSANDPAIALAPGGESVLALAQRTNEFAQEVNRLFPHGNVLVVTHGLALATLICHAENIALIEAFRLVPDNAQPVNITWPPASRPI
jgi:alpha-ribazole phosphatase/probable phosphoglycerate mutase